MPILTLPEAKRFLKLIDADSDRDAELSSFLDGITPIVEREVGPVVQRQVTVLAKSTGSAAVLPTSNVLTVDSIVDRRDNGDLGTSGLVVDGAVLRNPSGSLPGGSDLLVTVTVGMNPIPPNVKAATKEILRLAWSTQRGKEAPAFLVSYRAQAYLTNMPEPLGFA